MEYFEFLDKTLQQGRQAVAAGVKEPAKPAAKVSGAPQATTASDAGSFLGAPTPTQITDIQTGQSDPYAYINKTARNPKGDKVPNWDQALRNFKLTGKTGLTPVDDDVFQTLYQAAPPVSGDSKAGPPPVPEPPKVGPTAADQSGAGRDAGILRVPGEESRGFPKGPGGSIPQAALKTVGDVVVTSMKSVAAAIPDTSGLIETGNDYLAQLTDAGLKQASIYTHDVGAQALLEQLVAMFDEPDDESKKATIQPLLEGITKSQMDVETQLKQRRMLDQQTEDVTSEQMVTGEELENIDENTEDLVKQMKKAVLLLNQIRKAMTTPRPSGRSGASNTDDIFEESSYEPPLNTEWSASQYSDVAGWDVDIDRT